MKILICGINHAPELTGIGRYTGDLTGWLAARGHQVRVVTAPPYYPQWQIGSGYSAWRWTRELRDGADVWRCPLWVPRRPGGVRRVLHLLSFAFSSLPVMLWQVFWRPDVVWVVEPPLLCAPSALLVGRLSGARTWLHVQDYEADAAFDLGLLKGDLARRVVMGIERWLMRRFNRVSTISRRMLDRAAAKGVPPDRLVFFPNWVELAEEIPADRPSVYRAQLGIPPDGVVALYSGNMGAKQGLELLAEAAQRCADAPALWFVFCGSGTGREALMAGCGTLPRVRFLDLQPAERVAELLAMADVHLLPQRADAADLVMPSKLTGMLASGRAVLATAAPGTELAAVLDGCGETIPPGDVAALALALRRLAADATLRARIGAAGRAYAVVHMERSAVLTAFERDLAGIMRP